VKACDQMNVIVHIYVDIYFFPLNKYTYQGSVYKHPSEDSVYKHPSENIKDCILVTCFCGGQILMLLLLTSGSRRGSLRSKKM